MRLIEQRPCADFPRLLAAGLLTIFMILHTVSCASVKNSADSGAKLRPVYITNTKKIMLLPPAACSLEVDGLQLLSGSFNGTTFSLLSYTQIDRNGVSLALMNSLGTDMGTLFYNGTVALFDSAFFPSSLPAEYILADIQNAFYDALLLQKAYSASHLRFEYDALQNSRCIYDGKKLIEEITVTQSAITIKNHLRGYEYQLVSAE